MKICEIVRQIEQIAPKPLSERLVREFGEYDNSGLLLGSGERDAARVLVCLDADRAAVAEAVAGRFALVVSHHPLIYQPIAELTDEGEQGHIAELAARRIAVYSAHLSLDAARGGVNASLAEALGLTDARPLMKLGEGEGLCWAGDFAGKILDLCARVRRVTGSPLRLARHAAPGPLKVCVANGGAADIAQMRLARAAGCNTLVSGDARHHAFVWAENNRFNLIDAGHFETEHFFLQTFAGRLQAACPGVDVVVSAAKAPYQFV